MSASVTLAAGLVPCEGATCSICDLIKLVHNVITYAIELSFALAVGMVVFGGYHLLTAGGSEEKVTQGRKIVWYAAVGLAIVLSGWIIVNTIFMILTKSSSWTQIPDDCGLPGISNTLGGPAKGAAGALEPQGPVGPNGQVPTMAPAGAPGEPAPEGSGLPTAGPSRDLMSN